MPTQTLGKVKLTPRGEYDPAATYVPLDIVSYGGGSYCVLKNVTGVTPTGDDVNYQLIAKSGADGKSPQISASKTWLVWDANAGEYVDSGVSAAGAKGEDGDPGKAPIIGSNGNWYEWDDASGAYTDTGKPSRGEKGNTGASVTIDDTLTLDGRAADAKATGDAISALSEEIADGVSWNELKDKPFYLEKTLVVELTKDDFTVNDQDGYIDYMYRSTPKLDWFVSAESIAFEIEIVDTNGRRYTATQDSIDVRIGKDSTDDDREYWSCYSDLFEIVSGVDLDLYDDEYLYKDEWGVLVDYYGLEFSEINIKIYRVDVKKIPKICLDAAIGKTAITVGSVLYGSEGEIPTNVVVPDLLIPISPTDNTEGIYYDRIFGQLRTSGDLFPYIGTVDYTFNQEIPTTAGSSISFDISSEGDTLWDKIGWNSPWYYGRYSTFKLNSYYGGVIEFLACGNNTGRTITAVAASSSGHLYTVLFKYTNNYKTLNVTIKCVA